VSRGHGNKEHIKEEVSKVFLPYIQGTTKKIVRVLKNINIGATFKTLTLVRNSLKFVKDPIDHMNQKGVYMIPCSCGKPYLGEIDCSIQIKIQEHVMDIKHNHVDPSTLAKHSDKMCKVPNVL